MVTAPADAGLDIHHEPASHRFVVRTAEGEAVLEYSAVDGTTLDFHHTFVPPALRGGGIASQLTKYALRWAQDHGIRVHASCPFVARYVERHPEFRTQVV